MRSYEDLLKFFERMGIKPFTKKVLVETFRRLGVQRGDIVHIESSFLYMGHFEGVKSLEEYSEKLIEAFFEILEPEGTLVVTTHTTQVIKLKIPFILEETKGDLGLLAEHILKKTDSLRSLHPVSSICALGNRKKEICGNVSSTNYGLGSAYDRLYQLNAKGMLMGLSAVGEYATTLSWIHYAEARFNVPYVYNKIIEAEVFAGGKKVDKIFTGTFRYLNQNVQYGVKRANAINGRLKDSGKMASADMGMKGIHLVRFSDYVEECQKILNENIYGLLDDIPDFKSGVIPFA